MASPLGDNAPDPSEAEVRHLKQLQGKIDRAISNGRLSRRERDEIMDAIQEDGKFSAEEGKMFAALQSKIWRGEVIIDD